MVYFHRFTFAVSMARKKSSNQLFTENNLISTSKGFNDRGEKNVNFKRENWILFQIVKNNDEQNQSCR